MAVWGGDPDAKLPNAWEVCLMMGVEGWGWGRVQGLGKPSQPGKLPKASSTTFGRGAAWRGRRGRELPPAVLPSRGQGHTLGTHSSWWRGHRRPPSSSLCKARATRQPEPAWPGRAALTLAGNQFHFLLCILGHFSP